MQAHRTATPERHRSARNGTSGRARPAAPGGVLLVGDGGARAAGVLDLQRTAGNRAVALLMSAHDGGGNSPTIRLHGQTSGAYDGGSSKILNRRVRRSRDCDCPDESPCLTATGTLKVTYRVDVTIVMPDMPSGLNACQQRRVRTFLRDVLGPHEQDHARRLRTYDGTTSRPFSVNACGQQALTDDVNSTLQQMHDDEAQQRASDADARSAAIDPFEREIDLDC